MRAAREAIGPDSLLMVDAGGSDAFWPQGYKWALRTAEMLADYDVAWFEEPLLPDALEDYVQLREHSTVPIAGGEVLTRRQSFQPWLEAGAFDIVQPDVTKVGGISEERRIAWMAQRARRALHSARLEHGGRSGRGSATGLGLSGHRSGGVSERLALHRRESLADGWRLDADGMLPIPTAPGLGLKLNRDAVAKYTHGERLFD